MSMRRFRILIDQLCKSLNMSTPGAVCQALHITLHGRAFSLYYGGVLAPDSLLLHCDFGAMPDERRELVLLRLLEINSLLFSARGAAFSYDPSRRHVVLGCRLALETATPGSTLEACDYFSGLAQSWSQHHFLASDAQC